MHDFDYLTGRTWYHQRFDGCPLYLCLVGEAETRIEERKPAGTEARWRVCFFTKGGADWYLDMADIEEGAQIICQLAEKSATVSTDLMQKWQADDVAFTEYFGNFSESKLRKLDDSALASEFAHFHQLATNRFTSSAIIDHFALGTDQMIADRLHAEAGSLSTSEFNRLFSVATAPVHRSFITEAELSLLEIALQMQKGITLDSPELAAELNKHQQAYFWKANNYITAQVLPVDYFRQEISSWLASGKDLQEEHDAIVAAPAENKRAKAELLEKYPLSQLTKRLLIISEDFTRWQDERKNATFYAIHMGNCIASEMARRRGIDPELTKFLAPPEVIPWFENGTPHSEELKTRQEECVLILKRHTDTPVFEVYTGEQVAKLKELLLGTTDYKDVQDIRGLVACTGRAIGTARILLSATEIDKVKEGDILIAVMTRPDYLPAMKKAAAIVTNEGGITSHAAIVARELGKPCIIGTKIATKVFQDGDQIEVNANHNWIRKVVI